MRLRNIIAVVVVVLILIFVKVKQVLTVEKKIFSLLIDGGLPPGLALLVVAQSKHETALGGVPYTSRQYLVNNNCFGYGYVPGGSYQVAGGGGKHPEDSGVYAKYVDIDHSVLDIVGYYTRRSQVFFKITNTQEFGNALKLQGYYTDSPVNYVAGLNHFYKSVIV
jgi:hypothetical protein